MLGLWSFWTHPHEAGTGCQWENPLSFWLAWGLSVELGRRHFPKLSLVTDDAGARILVDGLGLPFDSVSTALNGLQTADPHWWALGKLHAYRSQTEPFVHVDSDVFLWQPLPGRLLSAPVLAQNPEHFLVTNPSSYYRVREVETLFEVARRPLPLEWQWYSASADVQVACCCGILGGTNVAFLQYYADLAINLVQDPDNAGAWQSWHSRALGNLLVEQYLLNTCISYTRHCRHPRFAPVDIEYLFPTQAAAFEPALAQSAGFTHLIAAAKKNKVVLQDLDARVRSDYPSLYERALRLADVRGECS